jgi:hypothetical protein
MRHAPRHVARVSLPAIARVSTGFARSNPGKFRNPARMITLANRIVGPSTQGNRLEGLPLRFDASVLDGDGISGRLGLRRRTPLARSSR